MTALPKTPSPIGLPETFRSPQTPQGRSQSSTNIPATGSFTTPNSAMRYNPSRTTSNTPIFPKSADRGYERGNSMRGNKRMARPNNNGRAGNVGGLNAPSLSLIACTSGDQLLFSETNLDWTKLNIFRTRLCDRLTQTRTCHMANRCLFSHEINWPRRTPFLPRASALTLRYVPVWCPRLTWPPLEGHCDSLGKVNWISKMAEWDAHVDQSLCSRGDHCPFVHSLEEFLYHPEVYKTRNCCLANDDNFDEQLHGSCVALCPWYFCPFAHDVYEIRDLRASRFAWHPPPQMVDNQFVARTQGFDDLEMAIIDYIRKAPSTAELYCTPYSPLLALWRHRLPPVLRPMPGSALDQLVASKSHRMAPFDDMLYMMIIGSLMNLMLYPVENFYIPTLLSLQCAILQFQLHIGPSSAYDCKTLLTEFDSRCKDTHEDSSKSEDVPSKVVDTADNSGYASTQGGNDNSPGIEDGSELQTILDMLQSDEILRVMQLLESKNV